MCTFYTKSVQNTKKRAEELTSAPKNMKDNDYSIVFLNAILINGRHDLANPHRAKPA